MGNLYKVFINPYSFNFFDCKPYIPSCRLCDHDIQCLLIFFIYVKFGIVPGNDKKGILQVYIPGDSYHINGFYINNVDKYL